MKTIAIYVPGIMTVPGRAENWCGKAVTWTHVNTDYRAEKVEYLAGPLRRPWKQGERAKKLASTILRYLDSGWQIILVGHSNGGNVVINGLEKLGYPRVQTIHFISAACEHDFEKNGMNKMPVGSITVWIAEKDKAMNMAGTLGGKFLGYGTLGRDGAKNAKMQINYIREPYGHVEWFTDENFHKTMNRIVEQHLATVKKI